METAVPLPLRHCGTQASLASLCILKNLLRGSIQCAYSRQAPWDPHSLSDLLFPSESSSCSEQPPVLKLEPNLHSEESTSGLLAATVLCLLAYAGNFVHGCDDENLEEIIHVLNRLSNKGTPCTKMLVPDIFTTTKNPTEEEILCRTRNVLRKFYISPTPCLNNTEVLKDLKKVFRSISSMSQLKNCTVNESAQTTLKDFLESLRRTMQKKYLACTS